MGWGGVRFEKRNCVSRLVVAWPTYPSREFLEPFAGELASYRSTHRPQPSCSGQSAVVNDDRESVQRQRDEEQPDEEAVETGGSKQGRGDDRVCDQERHHPHEDEYGQRSFQGRRFSNGTLAATCFFTFRRSVVWWDLHCVVRQSTASGRSRTWLVLFGPSSTPCTEPTGETVRERVAESRNRVRDAIRESPETQSGTPLVRRTHPGPVGSACWRLSIGIDEYRPAGDRRWCLTCVRDRELVQRWTARPGCACESRSTRGPASAVQEENREGRGLSVES